MQRAREELEPNDGEDEDSEHDEQADLHQRRQRLENRFQHHLQAWKSRGNTCCSRQKLKKLKTPHSNNDTWLQ